MHEAGRGRVVVLVVLALVAVGALVATAVLVLGGDDEGPGRDQRAETPREEEVLAAALRFAAALSRGAPGEAGTVQPADVVTWEHQAAVGGLGELALEVTAGAVTLGEDLEDGGGGPGTATVPLASTWTVGGATWRTRGVLALEESEGTWRARWALAALDDRLRPGDVLAAESGEPERAAILDGAGQPLVAPTPVVHVGVVPQRATDVDGLAAELARLLDIDAAALATRIRAAAPTAFVDVITLRRGDYDPIRDQLQPLPGTAFREGTQLLAPSRSFARALLGTVGPATEEQAAASEGRLAVGDLTGQSGLQARYDAQLRGTPGLVVTVVRAPAAGPGGGTTTTVPAGTGEPEVLEEVPGTPGTPVRTTLDVATQEAAEGALAGESRVSTLVAIRPSTGEVVAVANGPTGTTSNVGTTGRVPPGSTFKVVSTLAHLRRGLDVDGVVPCPATATVGGRSFRNAGGFALGAVPFRTDFARSCNTAFVGLAPELGPDDLAAAGRAFGLGVEADPGVAAYVGSVPPTEGPVDAAAASIGQGRLQVSPLGMAGVAATVAAGTWRAPRVVTDPAPAAVAEQPLGPGEAETLRSLMRGVVTGGTGEALAGLPGGEVFAKTGTAEYGTEVPPRTHAWVIGFQGDLAFAVFVEGGESGGGVAAPIAARFLTALAGG